MDPLDRAVWAAITIIVVATTFLILWLTVPREMVGAWTLEEFTEVCEGGHGVPYQTGDVWACSYDAVEIQLDDPALEVIYTP